LTNHTHKIQIGEFNINAQYYSQIKL
jgi:hypothetical protein